ncbi:ABC transporter substrate-binding protein [Pseudorhodoplanes sp.]|uniref:ABC transporter substrate-binding protein n=1 Tax=Pseudorhodoplanes sp. TaxID=1934341 RepID=UPI003D11C1A8
MRRMLLGIATAAMAAGSALAQDGYVIGATAGLTGPTASTFAPVIEGIRIYFDRVNASGGINGKPVKFVILDDQGEALKAGTNVRRLLTQENVSLIIHSGLSSTFAPTLAEAQRAGVPVLFVGSACPKEVHPPAAAGQFCTTAFASNYDSRGALSFIKETAKEPVRIGFAAAIIPLSRAEIEFAEKHAESLGMTPVGKELIPPATADYTSFATKLKDANPTWVYSWAPWIMQTRLFESLRRLGWTGSYIAWAHQEAETELKRLKDPNFYVIGTNTLFQEQLPVHKEIEESVAKVGSRYPANQMSDGWIGALVIEAALKQAGWPVSPAKIQAALENIKVDLKGMRGAPIEWNKANHFRLRQAYRVYKWDEKTGRIVTVTDKIGYDIK